MAEGGTDAMVTADVVDFMVKHVAAISDLVFLLQSERNFVINEVYGDLFSCPSQYSLAHCISADVKMGKGIAVLFKKKFHGVGELMDQGQRAGGMAVLKRGDRYIYYLVTKERYWHKPTYETLGRSLLRMKEHNIENNVHHVCMPKIGCGLDKLHWEKVLEMIRNIYEDTDIKITVYHLEDSNPKRHQRGHYKGYSQQSECSYYNDNRFLSNQPHQRNTARPGTCQSEREKGRQETYSCKNKKR